MDKKKLTLIIIILICFVMYLFSNLFNRDYINSSNPESENNNVNSDIRNSTDRAIYINSLLE